MSRRFPTPLFGVPTTRDRFYEIVSLAHQPDAELTWDEYRDRCQNSFSKADSEEGYSQSYIDRISSTFVQLGLVDRDDGLASPAPPGREWLDGTIEFEEFLWRALKRRWVLMGEFPEGMEALERIHHVVANTEAEKLARGEVEDRLATDHGYEFNEQGIRGYPDLLEFLGAIENTENGFRTTDSEAPFKQRFRDANVFHRLERRLRREGVNTTPPDDRVKRDLAKYYMYRESGGWTKRRTWYETFWKDYLTNKARRGKTTASNFDVRQKYIDARNRRDELKDEICTTFKSIDRPALGGLSVDVLQRMQEAETVVAAQRIKIASGSGISRADLDLLGADKTQYTFPEEFSLYDWQQEAANQWFQPNPNPERSKQAEQGIAKVVTGAGKTVMALEVIRRWLDENPDGVVTVVVPTRVLMRQWLTELRTKLQVPTDDIGWAGGGHKDSFEDDRRVLVSIINSAVKNDYLGKELASAGETPHLLVADECHGYTGEKFSNIFSYPNDAALGLSATPLSGQPENERTDGDELLLEELGSIYYELTYTEGLERGLIPRFTVKYIGLDLTDYERQRYDQLSRKVSNAVSDIDARYGDRLFTLDGNYAQKLQVLMNNADGPTPAISDYFQFTQERRELIANAVQRQAITHDLLEETIEQDKKAIVFQERIEQLEQMIAPYEGRGINARTGQVTDGEFRSELYDVNPNAKRYDQKLEDLFTRAAYKPVMYHSGHSRTVWNDFAMEWFRNGFANVMLSVKALIEGVDVPSADVGIVRVSSGSVRQRIQTLGRVLRTGQEPSRHSEMYVLYARDTVDEQIFADYDWDEQLANADVEHYIWEPADPAADDLGQLREAGQEELPEPSIHERSIPDADDLERGDPYPGPRDGYTISVNADGDPFEKTADGRQPIVTPEIEEVASYVHDRKGGGTIIINEANHLLTILEDGPVFLGTIDSIDEIVYGDIGDGLTDDPPSFDEI